MASTTRAANKDLVQRAFAAWNEQDRDAYASCHTEDVILHEEGEQVHGREEVIASQWSFFETFSDAEVTLEEMIAEDEMVALRYSATATHDGPFGETEPTGKRVELSLMAFVRCEDGKIAEKWIQADSLGLMEQVDAIETSTA